jgi:hypothetical protein
MSALMLPFRLLGIVALAVLATGAWLFRSEIVRAVKPGVAQVREALGAGAGAGMPDPQALTRARDKVDSMHGWDADSVMLTANEMASLLVAGLPREIGDRVDSLSIRLGEGRVTVSARLATAQFPAEVLGPLAGALQPWEPVSVEGAVVTTGPGRAEWRVESLSLRGFRLPAEASRRLVERGLPGVKNGALPFGLPKGVIGLRIRPEAGVLYRRQKQ